MSDSETIKRVLLSVLTTGNNSTMFNQFYKICMNFSAASLCVARNKRQREELTSRLDCSVMDLASECIADLFEIVDDKFIRINNYFDKKFPDGIQQTHQDIIKVHLAVLIKSKTNQSLSELKEDLGDIYPKIKKSLDTFLSRKKDEYRKFIKEGVKYISYDHLCVIDFSLPQIEKRFLVSKMLRLRLKNCFVATVMPEVFRIISKQDEYCKAIKEKLLLEALKEYYEIKMNDSLKQ